MTGKRDLKYYQAKSSKLEAEVINMQYKIRELDRIIARCRGKIIPTLRSRVRELERIVANCCRHTLHKKKVVADEGMATVKIIEGRGVSFTIKEKVGRGGNGG